MDIEKLITQGLESFDRYYSSYRAVVVNNNDPEGMNRLKVAIPGIHGGEILWALPKGQHGGNGSGFKYLAPAIGDIVWISFEFGDLTQPLWEYHSWAPDQIPEQLNHPEVMGFVTPNGVYVLVDDTNCGVDVYIANVKNKKDGYGNINIYTPGSFNVYTKDGVLVGSEKPVTIYSEDDINITSKAKVVVNEGNNDGVIKIKELTDKLNNLVKEVDLLRTTFNTHTHQGILPGPAATPPPAQQDASPVSPFNKEDYEDKNFLH